ncbi:MAG: hypothetical protein V7703_19015, partial [Hyphomicrobiales bacterium]
MNLVFILICAIFAAAIILAIIGFFRFFRHLPAFLQARAGSSVAVHRFRYQEYVDWLTASKKTYGNALLLFAAGMALALMAFPF